jgi:hypothetical protein
LSVIFLAQFHRDVTPEIRASDTPMRVRVGHGSTSFSAKLGPGRSLRTQQLREQGALRGVISTEIRDPAELVATAKTAPEMIGRNLVEKVALSNEHVYGSNRDRMIASDGLSTGAYRRDGFQVVAI